MSARASCETVSQGGLSKSRSAYRTARNTSCWHLEHEAAQAGWTFARTAAHVRRDALGLELLLGLMFGLR